MSRAGSFVHRNPEAGCFGNLPITIDHMDRALDNFAVPRHRADHFFLDDMIRSGDREMKWGNAGDGSKRIVGATPMAAVSAIAAIFLASSRPPQWQMSGWAMSMAR